MTIDGLDATTAVGNWYVRVTVLNAYRSLYEIISFYQTQFIYFMSMLHTPPSDFLNNYTL